MTDASPTWGADPLGRWTAVVARNQGCHPLRWTWLWRRPAGPPPGDLARAHGRKPWARCQIGDDIGILTVQMIKPILDTYLGEKHLVNYNISIWFIRRVRRGLHSQIVTLNCSTGNTSRNLRVRLTRTVHDIDSAKTLLYYFFANLLCNTVRYCV